MKKWLYIRKKNLDLGQIQIDDKCNLSALRNLIEATFDEFQLEALTKSYSFLHNGFIVSKKQESVLLPFSFLKPEKTHWERDEMLYVLEVLPQADNTSLQARDATDSESEENIENVQEPQFYTLPPPLKMPATENNTDNEQGPLEYETPKIENEDFLEELPPTVRLSANDRKHNKLRSTHKKGDFGAEERYNSVEQLHRISRMKTKTLKKKITLYGYPEGPKELKMKEILSFDLKVGLPFWIDVQAASIKDIELIGRHFELHPLTIEDISMKDSREKLEIFGHYLLVIFYSEHYIMQKNVTENPISILLFSNFVLSFHNDHEESIENLCKKINSLSTKSIRSPSWICYAVLDRVVDDIIPVTDKVIEDIVHIEDIGHTFRAENHNEFLVNVTKLRRNITLLRQRLFPKENMIKNMLRKTYRKFLRDISAAYLRDVLEHVSKMLHSLEIQHENLNNIQNMFLAKVSLEVAESSHKLDQVTKTFGSIATIMLPLTFVTGLLGMNVTVPFQSSKAENDPNSIAFFSILGACIIFGLLIYFYGRRKKIM